SEIARVTDITNLRPELDIIAGDYAIVRMENPRWLIANGESISGRSRLGVSRLTGQIARTSAGINKRILSAGIEIELEVVLNDFVGGHVDPSDRSLSVACTGASRKPGLPILEIPFVGVISKRDLSPNALGSAFYKQCPAG